jgi:hypothetical protein
MKQKWCLDTGRLRRSAKSVRQIHFCRNS